MIIAMFVLFLITFLLFSFAFYTEDAEVVVGAGILSVPMALAGTILGLLSII